MHALDIAVVGAGTAGSAAALFLARSGHRVTLYEHVLDPHPVGAGIVLQPTGLAVMALLGLDQAILSHAERLDRLWCTTPSGRTVVDLSYQEVLPGAFGLGLHRGVLFQTLFNAARAEAGVTLKLGVGLDAFNESRKGVTLTERGSGARREHELVVVCNGARSTLRDDTPHAKHVEKYAWGALWAVLPDPVSEPRRMLRQVVNGTRRLIGLLPTGRGPQPGSERLLSLFFSLRGDQLDEFRAGDFAAWRAGVVSDLPEAEPIVSQLQTPDDLLFSEYHDVTMWPWNTGRVVYLGDAAHATSPQLGQGCNLALLDAWVLSQSLAGHDVLHDALFAYSGARRSHLGWYQFITRWLTPFFQSSLWPLGLFRDLVFGPSTSVGFVRRQMVEAMAGISRGPLCKALPLPRAR